MIEIQKQELADSVEAALSQLRLKEEQLQAKERDLKLNSEVVSQLYRQWILRSDKVKVTLGELQLWRRQAEAISRSSTHLETIEGIIKSVEQTAKEENDLLPTCEVDFKVFQYLVRDREKFHDLAFSSINRQKQPQLNFDFDLDRDKK